MKISNINEMFGNALLAYGVIKIVFVFIALINAIGILIGTGSGSNIVEVIESVSNILSVVWIIIIIGSLIMLIINKKNDTRVTKGYTTALVTGVIETIIPSIYLIDIFINIFICMEYIKSGKKIKEDNGNYYSNNNLSNKTIAKKSEWFYSDSTDNKNRDKELEKIEKERMQIQEEIEGWHNLLETEEITKEMYDAAIEELEKKLQKLNK